MTCWKTLLLAISLVESSGNPNAFNSAENAAGLYQIRPGYVQCANEMAARIGRHDLFFRHPDDPFIPERAEKIIILYMKRYAPENATAEQIARIHNGGPQGHLKYSTENYWRDVKWKIQLKN
jgi:hypothetical protein